MLWTHTNTVVPPFHDQTTVALPVPCTFDFNVAATKYFAALSEGEVPLNLMFSGTVFYEAADGTLQAEQIPWDKEARFWLPVWVWKEMIDLYYPNSAWLCLRRDVSIDYRISKWNKVFPAGNRLWSFCYRAAMRILRTSSSSKKASLRERGG